MKQIVGLVLILCCTQIVAQEVFPDGRQSLNGSGKTRK